MRKVNSVREIVDLWEAGHVSRGGVVSLVIDIIDKVNVDHIIDELPPGLREFVIEWVRENYHEGARLIFIKGPDYEKPASEEALAAIRDWIARNPPSL